MKGGECTSYELDRLWQTLEVYTQVCAKFRTGKRVYDVGGGIT